MFLKSDLFLAPIDIQDQGAVEDLQLLHGAQVVHFEIKEIVFLRNVLVHNFLPVILFLQVNVDEAMSFGTNRDRSHRLKLVRVLAESLGVLCEIYLNVGHVANLICGQDTKNAFFSDRLKLAALEPQHVDVGLASFVACEPLTEKRQYGFDIATHIRGRLLLLAAVVQGLLDDLWSTNLGWLDVSKVCAFGILATSVLLEELFSGLDDFLDVLLGLEARLNIHLIVESAEIFVLRLLDQMLTPIC